MSYQLFMFSLLWGVICLFVLLWFVFCFFFNKLLLLLQEYPYLFTYRNSNYSFSEGISNTKEALQVRQNCLQQGYLRFSFQAGNGAASNPHDVLDVLTQYRGISWSVGGNENISTVTTLANILREFNPSLIGYSTGTGTQTTENAALNQAVAGAKAEDVPAQVRRLVDRMINDSRINMQSDWKLITLFIGGNDLCQFCEDPVRYSPENYTYNIQVALDMLHKEVPRAFVNLVTILSITSLRELYAEKNVSCPRLLMRMMCPCVLNYDDNSSEYEQLVYFNKRYQERTRELVESGRYDTREDFTVVMQPFLTHISMPKTQEGFPDNSYFAPDCFHFSQKSHSQAARSLWNNMVRFLSSICYSLSSSTFSITSLSFAVHSLKPADVKIIAALGDSLTVRRQCFYCSLGRTTNIYIFREFNAKIKGYSTGTGSENDPNAFLNQAVPGAQAEHLPAQARALLSLMKTDSRIDFSADWKIITVHIGGNDLCNYCKDPVSSRTGWLRLLGDCHVSVEMHRSLDKKQQTLLCTAVDGILVAVFWLLQLGIQRLVESGRYDTHDSFTVVVQTFLHNPKIPLDQDGHPDISYFAPDCFHPSQKGHSQLAKALWNTMHFMSVINYYFFYYSYSFLVHELQPADIKVIGALGDSLTVSTAISPDILKKFSPNLFGFSTGNSREAAGFNAAERGATSHNMPAQARELVELMRSSSKINFKEDWKLITIFIGGNDLCQYCLDKVCISEAVVSCSLTRVFINMVEILEISGLRQVAASSSKCAEALQLVNSGRYEQREDFAVVVQPFFRNTILPLDSNGKPDLSFFAADCFHFSEKGYAEMAMALWNNMMEPVGEKQTYNNFTYDRSKLKCPNPEKPFLSTLRNSGFRNSALNLEKTQPSVPYWAVIVAAVAGVLVGSLLLWAVSGRARRHRCEIDAEKNMKTTSL
uniref:Phospholipase B1, membrane-associated n=1 Tax=Coturnix japonica TaxID=93934 RepID=A0A8C2TD65_COTJA